MKHFIPHASNPRIIIDLGSNDRGYLTRDQIQKKCRVNISVLNDAISAYDKVPDSSWHDIHGTEWEYDNEYMVIPDDGKKYVVPTLSDAIECCVGAIPENNHYYCKASVNGKAKHFSCDSFREVVAWYWENPIDFTCRDLDEEEKDYIESVKMYKITSTLDGDK